MPSDASASDRLSVVPAEHRASRLRDYLESEILARHVNRFFESEQTRWTMRSVTAAAGCAYSRRKRAGHVLYGYRTDRLTLALERTAGRWPASTRF